LSPPFSAYFIETRRIEELALPAELMARRARKGESQMLSNYSEKPGAELEAEELRVPAKKTGSPDRRRSPGGKMMVVLALFCAGLAALFTLFPTIVSGLLSRKNGAAYLRPRISLGFALAGIGSLLLVASTATSALWPVAVGLGI
jgi:hypothetical protein